MRSVSPYLHALDGRLRVKVLEIKGSPVKAREIETQIGRLPGVEQASANPLTANVLIFYDPDMTGADALLDALHERGYLREMGPPTPSGHIAERWGTIVLRATTELAIQRLITALL